MQRATDTAPTTDEQVHGLDQLFGLGNAIKLEFLRALDRFDRSEAWREDGAASLEDWVAYRYGMTWPTAAEQVRTMRGMRNLPKVAAAFASGRIAEDVFVDLCSFVEATDDDAWADRAQRLHGAEVKKLARQARRVKRESAEVAENARYFNTPWDARNDCLNLYGRIPGADGLAIKKTLDRMVEQMGPRADGTWEPAEQRRADALVELVGAHIGSDTDADRATIAVHVDARELNHVNGTAMLENGAVIPSETARRLACDGRVEVVLHGPNGEPVGIGRKSRIVPAPMMRQLRARDGGCVCCGRPIGVQAHHKIHWAHGGRTDLDNLVLVCRKCHKLVHERRFRLALDQYGQVVLVRPDGRPVKRRPNKLRPDVRDRMLGPPNRRD